MFIQRFDENWMENVYVEALNEVEDRDKLYVICSEVNNSKTVAKVCHSFKPYLPVDIRHD